MRPAIKGDFGTVLLQITVPGMIGSRRTSPDQSSFLEGGVDNDIYKMQDERATRQYDTHSYRYELQYSTVAKLTLVIGSFNLVAIDPLRRCSDQ